MDAVHEVIAVDQFSMPWLEPLTGSSRQQFERTFLHCQFSSADERVSVAAFHKPGRSLPLESGPCIGQ